MSTVRHSVLRRRGRNDYRMVSGIRTQVERRRFHRLSPGTRAYSGGMRSDRRVGEIPLFARALGRAVHSGGQMTMWDFAAQHPFVFGVIAVAAIFCITLIVLFKL